MSSPIFFSLLIVVTFLAVLCSGDLHPEKNMVENMMGFLFRDDGIVSTFMSLLRNSYGRKLNGNKIGETPYGRKLNRNKIGETPYRLTPEPDYYNPFTDANVWCAEHKDHWWMEGTKIVIDSKSISESDKEIIRSHCKGCRARSSLGSC